MAKLGEVCIQITDGSHNPPSGVEQSEYLMLSSKNIDDDFITLDSPRFLSHSDYIAENKRTTVSEGDLLMTIVGTIGRVAIVPAGLNGICLQRSVAVIKPNKEIINNRYLMYQLQNMRSFLEKEARGVAQKGIYLKQVSQLDIKLPELEQQKQIVKVLDKVTELISLRKQQLTKLDELVKARFVEMFGDPIGNTKNLPVTKFVDVVKMQRGFDLPVQERKSDGMIPIYGSNGVLGYHDISKVKGGGVITGRSGTIGKVFYEKGEFWPLNTTLFSLNSHGNDVVYLKYLLELFDLSRFTEGTGVPTLNRNKFHDELIIDVPLDEQERFAAFVERVDQQKQTVQQSLEKLELLKKALMQEYLG